MGLASRELERCVHGAVLHYSERLQWDAVGADVHRAHRGLHARERGGHIDRGRASALSDRGGSRRDSHQLTDGRRPAAGRTAETEC